jgi:hypothetical protein
MRSSIRRACIAVLLLVLVPASVLSESSAAKPARRKRWTPESFPNPNKDVNKCGRPGVKSSICDPENVLTTEQQNMVDGLVNEIASGFSPFKTAECGAAGQQGFQVQQQQRVYMHMHAGQVWDVWGQSGLTRSSA